MDWRKHTEARQQERTGPKVLPHRSITIVLRRRRERDEVGEKATFSGYDITWLDGRPVCLALQRLCHQGKRLLLGRGTDPEEAIVRVYLYPVSGLEAPLTRPRPGARCKRFYCLPNQDEIQLYFFTGTVTEVIFSAVDDDPETLHWLHWEQMRDGEQFWFDLGSEILHVRAEEPVGV